MTQDLKAFIKSARRASAPLIAVSTSDQPADEKLVREALKETKAPAVIRWTCLFGFEALDERSSELVPQLVPDGMDVGAASGRLEDALSLLLRDAQSLNERGQPATKLPEDCAILFWNAHRFLDNPLVVQGLMGLRDRFKASKKSLILFGNAFNLPSELANDFLHLDVAYPDRERLGQIVSSLYVQAPKAPPLTAGVLAKFVSAVQGLPAFGAEQVTATSLNKDGISLEQLWEKKRQMVSQTRGLSIYAGKERFGDVGGCSAIKDYLTDFFGGPERPECVFFLDEIDKAMAGSSGGDTSGVSQDILGAMLSWMDGTSGKTVPGVLLCGPPGAAKSAISKASGGEFEIPVVVGDIGAMKDSLVGESGKNVRVALKTVDAVANGKALVIATCNGIETLKPELRRRFTSEWFFDLPVKKDRDAIWKIWSKKFQVADKDRPEDEGWTGAEIRKACETAWRLKRSLAEAGKLVVPVSVSAKDQIEALRKSATDRFLDASSGSPYKPLGKLASLIADDRKRSVQVSD